MWHFTEFEESHTSILRQNYTWKKLKINVISIINVIICSIDHCFIAVKWSKHEDTETQCTQPRTPNASRGIEWFWPSSIRHLPTPLAMPPPDLTTTSKIERRIQLNRDEHKLGGEMVVVVVVARPRPRWAKYGTRTRTRPLQTLPG